MKRYHYPGDAHAIAHALDELGLEGLVTDSEVRRVAPYSRFTSLLGQASHRDDPAHAAAALAEAEKCLAPLAVCLESARLLVGEAREALGLREPTAEPTPPATAVTNETEPTEA